MCVRNERNLCSITSIALVSHPGNDVGADLCKKLIVYMGKE